MSTTTVLYTNVGLTNFSVLAAKETDLFNVTCVNLNVNTRYIQFFDKTSIPLSGEVPKLSYPVYGLSGASDLGVVQLGDFGLKFATGLAWGFSTTPLVFTPGNAVDNLTYIRYY